jgi:hydroxylamine reductase
MFCYQCEQTSQGQGCQTIGVCGKDENTATLQDLLIHALKGVSQYAHRALLLGAADAEIDAFTIKAIFATLTNVNFDEDRVADLVYQAAAMRDRAKALYVVAAAKAGIAGAGTRTVDPRRFPRRRERDKEPGRAGGLRLEGRCGV